MRPKDIGTRQETRIVNALNEYAGEEVAERVALHGSNDRGDLRIRVDGLVLTGESKHSKRYPSEGMMDEYRRQTVEENEAAGQDGGILFVNLPNRSLMRMECHMLKSTYLKLQGVDCLLDDERVPPEAAEEIWSSLAEDGEWDWICIPLSTLLGLAFGGREEGNEK